MILLMLLFGYMDSLIFIKWLTDFTGREHAAPSIIATMINMFLNGGKVDDTVDSFIGTKGT